MFIEQVPDIIRLFYRGVLWRMDKKEKAIYLTFDDGPTDINTIWILDTLDHYGIKATFFLIGKNVEQHKELYKEIARRGHTIGQHCYDHKRGVYKDENLFLSDINHAAEFIETTIFRPPHGHITNREIKKLRDRYKIVMWDVLTRDYDKSLSGDQVFNIACRYSRNGSIVVFHDSEKAKDNMRYALPKAIEYWLEQGYIFKKL